MDAQDEKDNLLTDNGALPPKPAMNRNAMSWFLFCAKPQPRFHAIRVRIGVHHGGVGSCAYSVMVRRGDCVSVIVLAVIEPGSEKGKSEQVSHETTREGIGARSAIRATIDEKPTMRA